MGKHRSDWETCMFPECSLLACGDPMHLFYQTYLIFKITYKFHGHMQVTCWEWYIANVNFPPIWLGQLGVNQNHVRDYVKYLTMSALCHCMGILPGTMHAVLESKSSPNIFFPNMHRSL